MLRKFIPQTHPFQDPDKEFDIVLDKYKDNIFSQKKN